MQMTADMLRRFSRKGRAHYEGAHVSGQAENAHEKFYTNSKLQFGKEPNTFRMLKVSNNHNAKQS
jgi:hypothetical protein